MEPWAVVEMNAFIYMPLPDVCTKAYTAALKYKLKSLDRDQSDRLADLDLDQ